MCNLVGYALVSFWTERVRYGCALSLTLVTPPNRLQEPYNGTWLTPGAIIGDRDRKSWDPLGSTIWENFPIFRTNCAILTSYIRANPRTCPGFSRGCCHVAWSKMVKVASFHGDGREKGSLRKQPSSTRAGSKKGRGCFRRLWIRQGRRTRALLCTFMLWVNGKGEFLRVENFFHLAIWMSNICSRFHCTRKLFRLLSNKTLHSGIELVCEFPKQCLIKTKPVLYLTNKEA